MNQSATETAIHAICISLRDSTHWSSFAERARNLVSDPAVRAAFAALDDEQFRYESPTARVERWRAAAEDRRNKEGQ